jgi:hypothetical protein
MIDSICSKQIIFAIFYADNIVNIVTKKNYRVFTNRLSMQIVECFCFLMKLIYQGIIPVVKLTRKPKTRKTSYNKAEDCEGRINL